MTTKKSKTTFRSIVTRYRQRTGATMAATAEVLGVSRQYLYLCLAGKKALGAPRRDAAAERLGVSRRTLDAVFA